MLYSCTHMATVGAKGLTAIFQVIIKIEVYCSILTPNSNHGIDQAVLKSNKTLQEFQTYRGVKIPVFPLTCWSLLQSAKHKVKTTQCDSICLAM